MRIVPDTRQAASMATSTGGKKTRKRLLSGGQDPVDEPEQKEFKSWIVDTADQVTVGEVYTLCSGTHGRLPLIYSWERRTRLEVSDVDQQG